MEHLLGPRQRQADEKGISFRILDRAATSSLVWAVSPWFTGHREPWDVEKPFYPVALLAAGGASGVAVVLVVMVHLAILSCLWGLARLVRVTTAKAVARDCVPVVALLRAANEPIG